MFEWDEELAVRPEHFADMVYQTCALTKGGCVSEIAGIRAGAGCQRVSRYLGEGLG